MPATARSRTPLYLAAGYLAVMAFFGWKWDWFYPGGDMMGDNYSFCIEIAVVLTFVYTIAQRFADHGYPLVAVAALPIVLCLCSVCATLLLLAVLPVDGAHYEEITVFCLLYALLSVAFPLLRWRKKKVG